MKAASPTHIPTCAKCDLRLHLRALDVIRIRSVNQNHNNDNPYQILIPPLMSNFRYGAIIRRESDKGETRVAEMLITELCDCKEMELNKGRGSVTFKYI